MVRPTRLVIRLTSIDLEHELDENDNIESINEYLDSTEDQYREFNRRGRAIVGENSDIPETVDISPTDPQGAAPTAEKPAPAKRSRKPKAAPEAVAPPPMPVPDAAPPAPMSVTAPAPVVDAGPIPPFLDRSQGALAPPPAVPAPVAAPAPAAPPPVGVLAPKVVAELNRRKEGQPDGGAGLIAWLAGAGLVVPSATWDEAILCIQFLDDAKLGPVAGGLGVA